MHMQIAVPRVLNLRKLKKLANRQWSACERFKETNKKHHRKVFLQRRKLFVQACANAGVTPHVFGVMGEGA